MNKNNRFYVTTPIYYASGKPHLGHAYTSIVADILARYNRELGREVFFLTGTDEHGQKIVEKASEINKTPKEFVDLMVPQFQQMLKRLNISNDYFIRTTDKSHEEFVSDMLQVSFDKGDIYKGSYTGLYCVGCERYYKEDELIDGKICPDHKKEVDFVEEENYFFKLSKYENELLKFYEENPDFLSPKSRSQETINRVKESLQDISISRSKDKLTWGIELPFDKSHVTYVWFDALFNYISALEANNKLDFWPANVQFIGKDIKWFHEVYFPAFLISCGFQMPKKIFSHGFILDKEGHKMSKSLGNVIDPIKFSKKYGVDEFRYYLMTAGSFGEDMNFDEDLFISKINNELNNDLGNLVSRVHAMTGKYFDGKIPQSNNLTEMDNEFIAKLNIFEKFNTEMNNLEINKAVETLFTAIRETNAYVNLTSPWKETDGLRIETVMNVLCSAVHMFTKYLSPFIPEKVTRILKQYNLEMPTSFSFDLIDNEITLGEKDNLFEKIKREEKVEERKEIEREGFRKLNLKVGQIKSLEKHPDSTKLYIIQVDLGSEVRQIVSGLQELYTIEELQDKKVIVITNLKPAKLGGYDSNGMILACEDENDCGLLTTENLEVGTNLTCNNEIADNDKEIKSKVFQKIEMFGKNQKVLYNNNEIKGISVDKKIDGKVC